MRHQHPRVIDTNLLVRTPENIAFKHELAGPFQRLMAYGLDVLLTIVATGLVGLLALLMVIFVVFPLAARFGVLEIAEGFSMMLLGAGMIIYFIIYWFYGALLETYFNGQTLGKRIVGLRVLTVEGHSIDGVQAILRNFFRLVDLAPFVPLPIFFSFMSPDFYSVLPSFSIPTCFLGLVMMASNSKFQRLGDWVAGTVVVSESAAVEPHFIDFPDPRIARLAELIPSNFIPSNNLVRATATYVDKRLSYHPQHCCEIASHVASPLLAQFCLPADTDYDLFLCALYHQFFKANSLSNLSESSNDRLLVGSPRWLPAIDDHQPQINASVDSSPNFKFSSRIEVIPSPQSPIQQQEPREDR